MNCHDCRHLNEPERNYCGACGTPLARFCIRCGFRNGAPDRYCGGCGASLDQNVAGRQAPTAQGPLDEVVATQNEEVAELLAAAQEAAQEDTGDGDLRVDQDAIDSLFGD